MQWTGRAEKVRIYVNTYRRTMQQIQKETGCDIIINGGLYDMATFTPVCHLKADGKVLASDRYTYLGYGWNDDAALRLMADYSAVKNYICCVCLARDGQKQTLWYDKGIGGARERTAIGTMPNGDIWVYLGSNPQTPEALQEAAMLAGVQDAIMLDGGASTQGIMPGYTSTSKRNVHNYICIWTEKGKKEDPPMQIIQKPANPKNYGGSRNPSAIRYLVLHYTGTDGGNALENGAYFARAVVQTSAHYFVDSANVVQSVPDNKIAWHCGAKTYYHPEARNANSIGIELCDDMKNGAVYPTQAAIDRALELTRWLMQKYNIPVKNVIRHWDVSHKACPAYWCGSSAKDALWKSAFWNRLSDAPAEPQDNATASVTVSLPVLKRGAKNASVRSLQALLTGLGYDPRGVDGSFGPGCQAAVQRYQQEHGLTADGSVGPATWRALLGSK